MKEPLTIERSQNRLITILAVGSRGDVQPYCALAIGLQRARYRETINQFRKETLDLPPLPFGGARFRRKPPSNLSPLPVLYGFSPSIIPKPIDWPDWRYVTGYWFLDPKFSNNLCLLYQFN